MDIVRLRTLWEEHVSTTDKEVLDKVWQILCERYWDLVVFACTNPEAGLEDLLEYTEPVIEGWRLGRGHAKPPGRVAQQIVDVDLDDYERQCAETASLYLAKKAASLPAVRRFRQERLGGKLLTTEEAKEFLKGEELSDLSGLDPRDKDAYIAWVNNMSAEELTALVIPSGHKGIVSEEDGIFPYSYEGGGTIVVGSKKELDYGGLILYLAAKFPWAPDEAGWFLLTGERPEVVPLRFSYHRNRRIFTLSFAPWISEKTIRKAYRKGQKVVQGGDNRRMTERTLAVMRFVTAHTDDEGNRPSWSQLTDLWNKEHPGEWRFKDRFGLRKTCLRAEKELARPW